MNVATDQAITKCSEDRFGRREFAARIAKVISSLKDTSSIVISVNAPWGEGKTSVLNMIEEKLDDSGNTLILRFNPWRFPDEERLLLSFFNTLAERLKIDLKEVSEKIGEGFKDFVHCLSNFQIAGFGIGGGVGEVLDKRLPDADIEEVKKRINAVRWSRFCGHSTLLTVVPFISFWVNFGSLTVRPLEVHRADVPNR